MLIELDTGYQYTTSYVFQHMLWYKIKNTLQVYYDLSSLSRGTDLDLDIDLVVSPPRGVIIKRDFTL